MVLTLESIGVPVKYHHHEVGGPGQCEIETPLLGILAAADASMKIKYATKMVAAASGLSATFLPKPLYGEAGSGMHFHQQLLKGGKMPSIIQKDRSCYRKLPCTTLVACSNTLLPSWHSPTPQPTLIAAWYRVLRHLLTHSFLLVTEALPFVSPSMPLNRCRSALNFALQMRPVTPI